MTTTEEIPVLIIGAGPSGATLALLLGRLGVKALSISKHRGSANTPRAHIFNQRAMEVLRDAGIEDALAGIATPAHGEFDLQLFLVLVTSLTRGQTCSTRPGSTR
jgi:2-polyprenyl-6-methoxyphenol hydroxylase-like FAD-dependent oxidoreductase